MTKMRYNCATCPGYCCSHSRIAISEFDIARLAKHFDLSPEEAKQKFYFENFQRMMDGPL